MKSYKLENEYCELEISNGIIISIKIKINSEKYEILGYDPKNYVSSFIMAPWANRIKDGKFNSNKGKYDFSTNNPFKIKHAIHGTVMFSEWKLENHSEKEILIKTNLSDPWPYKGSVKFKISLLGKKIKNELTITNEDTDIMPFSLGWHPWFKRKLKKEDLNIKFDAKYKWELVDSIPSSKKINSDEIPMFLEGFTPQPGTLDDCYRINKGSPVYLKWPEITLKINSSPECSHLMIYTPIDQNSGLICVEPQTATINAFQLFEDKVDDTGVLFVNSNESKNIFTEWSWVNNV